MFRLKDKSIIGMVHTLPLPGTVHYKDNLDEIIARAVQEARTLSEGGVDAIMIENMMDTPFSETIETEQVTALTLIANEVREAVDLPTGINAAFNDYKAALAVAHATGADFIRIPVYVDTMVYSGGIIQPCAKEAVRYRKHLNAEHIAIFADIQVKHAHPLTPEIPIEESAINAVTSGADAIVVTGSGTGSETPLETIERVKDVVDVPVLIGSGVNSKNISAQLKVADAAIVGSSLKDDKDISKPVSLERTKTLIQAKENSK